MAQASSAEGLISNDKESRCIAVRAAGGLYGLLLEHVQEVVSVSPLTRVFHAPAALAGVASLRGDVLPILDLGELVAERPTARGLETARFVVVRATGSNTRAGLLVEALIGLRDVPERHLGDVPATLPEVARRFVVGIVPDSPACALLDVDALFRAPELAAHAADGENQ